MACLPAAVSFKACPLKLLLLACAGKLELPKTSPDADPDINLT